jgi:hypothetical protein
MAAQPKNKITRAERGKRRKGNTPKLVKDAKVNKMPLHKQVAFARIWKMINTPLSATAKVSTQGQKDSKREKLASTTSTVTTAVGQTASMRQNARQQTPKPASATVKKTTRTQHKGG